MICLDERGPVAARTYPPGGAWAGAAHRPHFRPDYARGGYCWAYGALNHRTGEVCLETAETRDTASWLQFLDGLEAFAPAGEVYLIVDALPLHWTLDRLQEELNRDGVPIRRSQIRRLLKAEHIKWQKPRTWLESDDPDFAEKRGGSSGSTPTRPLAAP